MSEQQRHIIQKQFFDFRVAQKDGSFELQTQMSRLYWSRIVPAIEKLLDELVPANEIISIDRLSLNLNLSSIEDLEQELIAAILEELKDQLEELLFNSSPSLSAEKIQRTPLKIGRLAQWLHYLEEGISTWKDSQSAEEQFQQGILEILASEQKAIEQLRATFQQSAFALDRTILQYEETFLYRLVEVFSAKSQKALPDIRALLQKVLQSVASTAKSANTVSAKSANDFHYLFWKSIFQTSTLQQQKKESIKLAQVFVRQAYSDYFFNEQSLNYLQTTVSQLEESEKSLFLRLIQDSRLEKRWDKAIKSAKENKANISQQFQEVSEEEAIKSSQEPNETIESTDSQNTSTASEDAASEQEENSKQSKANDREATEKQDFKQRAKETNLDEKIGTRANNLDENKPQEVTNTQQQLSLEEDSNDYKNSDLTLGETKTNDATSFDEAKNNMAQEAQSLIEKDDQTTKKDTPNDAALDTSQNDPDSSVDKKDAIQAAEKRTEIKSKAKQNKKGETSEINIKETAQDISYSIQGDGTKTNIDTKTTDLEKVDEGSSALSSKKPTTPLEISEEISKKATLYYKEQAAGTTYYVQNAGIILLHPFLSHYFKGLELLEGKAFKDREAQQLAVHLLQYLATQQEQTAESDLLLMKFLCHLPLNYPVNRFMVLPENAKAEAENLLQAALNHWGALPNTTPNGLREGFLKRDGKLEKRGDAWHLVVEQKTIDILLARLPWNLSLVKLPWKKGLVYVEWNK